MVIGEWWHKCDGHRGVVPITIVGAERMAFVRSQVIKRCCTCGILEVEHSNMEITVHSRDN